MVGNVFEEKDQSQTTSMAEAQGTKWLHPTPISYLLKII